MKPHLTYLEAAILNTLRKAGIALKAKQIGDPSVIRGAVGSLVKKGFVKVVGGKISILVEYNKDKFNINGYTSSKHD